MKILIIEDEPQAAQILTEIIGEENPTAQVIMVTESISQSVKYLQTSQPDLIFSDIQLADGLCFEIFKNIEVHCPVIFCTAFDQYTLQAFKSNGIEYILKPVKNEDVKAAFGKVEKLKKAFAPGQDLLESIQQIFSPKKSYNSSILIRYRESFFPLPVENIGLFTLQNEVVYVFSFDQKKQAVFKTLDDLEESVDPALFFRINRQTLISRKAVLEIQPYFNRKMVIKTPFQTEEKLVVSRRKVTQFMEWMEKQ